jgi:hypothetical protein
MKQQSVFPILISGEMEIFTGITSRYKNIQFLMLFDGNLMHAFSVINILQVFQTVHGCKIESVMKY